MRRLDNKELSTSSSEIIVFCCVRNELLRLPYFLEYHRRLGVDRFIFIDNASSDGSADYLLSQDDVHVFYTDESYAESKCGVDWLNELLSKYGTGNWVLTLDADELFIYPMCESVNLKSLALYLDGSGSQAVATFMLDMYSEKPIKDTSYKTGQSFLETCHYFDVNSYIEYDEHCVPVRGGPRYRLFWQGYQRAKPSPVLKKIPFVKWRSGLSYLASTHVIHNVELSELTGVIQHFKFFSDFYTTTKLEVERKEHWDGAAQYDTYWDVMRKDSELSAFYDGSVYYDSSMQLVELSLMTMPDSFNAYIGSYIKRAWSTVRSYFS